ncbi:unnamed protein product, partial [Phaeothamnion confervicola]
MRRENWRSGGGGTLAVTASRFMQHASADGLRKDKERHRANFGSDLDGGRNSAGRNSSAQALDSRMDIKFAGGAGGGGSHNISFYNGSKGPEEGPSCGSGDDGQEDDRWSAGADSDDARGTRSGPSVAPVGGAAYGDGGDMASDGGGRHHYWAVVGTAGELRRDSWRSWDFGSSGPSRMPSALSVGPAMSAGKQSERRGSEISEPIIKGSDQGAGPGAARFLLPSPVNSWS